MIDSLSVTLGFAARLAATTGAALALAACSTDEPRTTTEPEASVERSYSPTTEDPVEAQAAEQAPEDVMSEDTETAPAFEVATFGAGCFWCVEAVFDQLEGVDSAVSGYMGGHVENPTYDDVKYGQSGHAEVVQVTFDPDVITYAELLDWFWRLHDPTTLNRQGPDRGTHYRSAIFVYSDEQRRIAETSKKDVQPSFGDPIVTEITDASTFTKAEGYHQSYYEENPNARYCRGLIAPKLKKLGLEY